MQHFICNSNCLGFKTAGCSAVKKHLGYAMILKMKWETQNSLCGWKITTHFTAAELPDWKLSNPSFVAPTDAMSFTYARPFMNITPWHLFSTGGKYFHTPQNSSLCSQADRWPSLSPLSLPVISLTVQEKLHGKKPRHHFLVQWMRLSAPVNLSCSFLVQF